MPTFPDEVNLAQIARLVGVGRAAVANWRRRHDNFPSPVGGTDTSPLFKRAAAEAWLRAHDRLFDFTTPTPAERAAARLTGLQLVRALVPGVLAETFVDTYEEEASHEARAVLELLRDYTKVADTLTEVVPLVLELGYLTASGLVTINQYDRARVDAWLTARARTAAHSATADPGGIGARADFAAVGVAQVAAEAMWVPDRDVLYEEHAQRAARSVWSEVRSKDEEAAGRARYELALSAGWLTAYVLTPALGGHAQRIDAHLDALARHLIDRPSR